MIWLAALICCLPTAIQILNDAKGDRRKINDIIAMALVSGVLAWVNARFFDIYFARTLALITGIHILCFDYIITYVLYRNKVIESPEARKWWAYMGKTSTWDRYVSRIHPLLRLLIRVIVFGAAIAIFITV